MTAPTTDEDRRTLTAVLDQLIPARPDGSLPGAGALGLAEPVAQKLGDGMAAVREGLAALEEGARAAGATRFDELDDEQAVAALNALGATHPGFLPGLVFHTYTTYYHEARVIEQLGVPPRPPHPEGYALELGDLGPLAAVRERGRLYRET